MTMLRQLLSAARRRWPGIELSDEDFRAHLQARGVDADGLADLHGEDLFLACACAHRDARAVALLEAQLGPEIDKAVAAIDRSRDFVDEVKQILRARLLAGDAPKIADYAGRGALGAWLRMAATRTALNLRRQAKNRRSAETREPPAARVESDAEQALLQRRYGRQVKLALQHAMARLDDGQRQLLRLHYLDGVSLQQIGRDRGVDRSTASRWVSAARDLLLAATKRELHEQIHIRPASLDSLLGAVTSQLDVSLSQLLPAERGRK